VQPGRATPFDNTVRYRALEQRVAVLERKLGVTARTAATGTLAAKRFRIAVKVLGVSLAGIPVQIELKWSAPMPTDVYNVDVACSGLTGMPTVAVTNQTKEGCTVTFTPSVVVTSSTVMALGISPAV
jgi:hypothetical protein